MTISILADGVEILEKQIKFSDGGSNIKIKTGLNPKKIVVTIKDEPVDSYTSLYALILDSINKYYSGAKTVVYVPYLPHGRADRPFEDGMIAPLLNICEWLNCFDEAIIRDPHSGYAREYFESGKTLGSTIHRNLSATVLPRSAVPQQSKVTL